MIRKDCKINDEMIAAVRGAVAIGMPIYKIAKTVGVCDTTFRWYLEKGQQEFEEGITDSPYVKIYVASQEGESAFITDNLNVIKRASARDWKAAAWLLERRMPEHFALKQDIKTQVEGITIVNDVPKSEVKTLNGGDISKEHIS